jgi:hypothetical protein
VGLYRVEYDQENGVISDLEKLSTEMGILGWTTHPEED